MIQVICNPASGNGRGKIIGQEIDEELTKRGVEHTLLMTKKPGEATDLARQAARDGVEKVLSVGGDGTTLEIAGGLYGSQTVLGIIPAGTGNDFIKTIGTPKKPMEALDAALNDAPRLTDMVRLNDRYFLNETGTGFDVSTLDYAEKAKKHFHGLIPYLYGVICTIFHFGGVHLAYTLDDGEEVERDVLVIGAGNGRFIGGGIPIAPDAVPDDGLLDVIVVSMMKKMRMLFVVLPGLMMGKIGSFRESQTMRVKKLTIDGKGRMLRMNIDGEIIPMERAEISVLPGALLICRP